MTEARRVGKYEILEELGRGGFAVVYKARDVTLNRVVALKVLLPQLTTDPKFVQRFQNEAQTAAQLRHPHIVTIYEVGQEKGVHYLAMTYLEGRTLDSLIAEKALSLAQSVSVVEQIASALDVIHARGLVHRDIKPANIMVGGDGQATLLDFGIVRAAEGTRLTTTMAVLGTPEYMAPEQAEVDEAAGIDWRADIYALGVVAYEVLVGQPPFAGTSPTAVLYKHVYEAPPKPTALNPALSPGVEPILLQALAKQRESRFQRASDFAAQLRKVLLVEPDARPVRLRPQPVPQKKAPSKSTKLPAWLVTGGVVAFLAVVVGLTTLFGFTQGWWGPATPTVTVRVTDDNVTDDIVTDEPTDEPTDDGVTVETSCTFDAAVVESPDIPWGVQVAPGETLMPAWQLLNTGECVWETGTQLIPLSGVLLDGPVDVSYASLSPGETMAVELALRAPEAPGVYEMTMQLQDPDALFFGPRIGFSLTVVETQVLPDFVVANIAVVDGDKLRCTYGNIGGDTPTEVLRIAFYVDGEQVSESNVGSSIGGRASLAAGEESWLQTTSLALPALFEATCVVDSGDDIAELDEENNVGVSELGTALPDLTVTDVLLVETSRVECRYSNVGGADIPEGEVWLTIYANGVRLAEGTLWTPIPAGNTGWYQAITSALSGQVDFECVVDSKSAVNEADESNNALMKTLSVP